MNVLLLGGTSEATRLAVQLAAEPGIDATLSLAGRTARPPASPLPVRSGGFGGAGGLACYLISEAIGLVIDATHPFAARISSNAVLACAEARIPLIVVERPPWHKTSADDWQEHATVAEAVAALPVTPCRIFSALGRSAITELETRPEHHYIIRVVDPLTPPPGLATATIIAARGPFNVDDDTALFRKHGVDLVLAKNSGGDAAYAKIEAARRLGIKVHLIRRPIIAERETVRSVDDAMDWIRAHYSTLTDRGV